VEVYVHSLVGWLWLLAWFFAALAFITSQRHTRSLVGWVERVAKTGLGFNSRKGKAGVLLSMAVFGCLAFFTTLLLLFLTPVLVVAYVVGTLRKGRR
jgi:hypothetical protein